MSRALRLLKRIPVTCAAPLASVAAMLRGEVAAVKRRVFRGPGHVGTPMSGDWEKRIPTRPWRRWTRRTTASIGSRNHSLALGRADRGFGRRGSNVGHGAMRQRLRRHHRWPAARLKSGSRGSDDSSGRSGWRMSASDDASATVAHHHHHHHHGRHRLCARCRRRDAVLDTFEQKIQTLRRSSDTAGRTWTPETEAEAEAEAADQKEADVGGIQRRLEVRVSAEARRKVGPDGVLERGNYTCTLSGDNGLVVPQKSRFFADHVHQDLYGSV